MNEANGHNFFSLDPQSFRVVAVYDDAATRERALRVCDHLVNLLWQDAELKFRWWRTDFFRDAGLARMAAQDATDSDLIIVANSNDLLISHDLEQWFETWADRREERDGALVNLVTHANLVPGFTYRSSFLRDICLRARLELLNITDARSQNSELSPDIKSALSQTQIYGHFGLNE